MNVKGLNTSRLKRAVLFCSLTFMWATSMFAQCPDVSVTCNPVENVFLGAPGCTHTVMLDDILEGAFDPACYAVSLFLDDGTPLAPADEINSTHIGLTLDVVITNIMTGTESCAGSEVNVFDSIDPVLTACDDVTVDCGDSTDPADIGEPTVTDCDPNTLTFEDTDPVDGTCLDPFLFTFDRTWTATDGSGNESTCTQTITVDRLMFDPGTGFPADITVDCGDPTTPATTGYPTIAGMDITSESVAICGFTAHATDNVDAGSCAAESTILRSWTVFDLCGNSWTSPTLQVITVDDSTAPSFTDCPNDITVSTTQYDCVSGTITLESAVATDDCSTISYETTVDGIVVVGTVSDLDVGVHTVEVTATDACGNVSIVPCTYTITVEDDVQPAMSCETSRVVTLNGSGPTLVPASVFDDGSWDNCGTITFLARRMDSPDCDGNVSVFSEFVPFYCCDVDPTGTSAPIMVILQASDGVNTNTCMVEVTVDDKNAPNITCPADVTVDCMDNIDPSIQGTATATDDCSAAITYTDAGTLNNCGVGTITRTWKATDPSGNADSCDQVIVVANLTPFLGSSIIWPANMNLTSCNDATDISVTGVPVFTEDDCDQVDTLAHVDVRLEIGGCLTILRKWTVFDNCQTAASTSSSCDDDLTAANIAHWCFTQVITVIESDDPTILSSCDDRAFPGSSANCTNGTVSLILDATDDCNPNDLTYLWEIDIDNDDNNNPEFTDNTNDASGTYDLGTHRIYWRVEDKCGNFTECDYLFTIADSTAPQLTTFDIISAELDPGTSIEHMATDWVVAASTMDNCGIVEYLVNVPSAGVGQNEPPVTAGASYTFTCADRVSLGDTVTVDVWVRDANFNWTYTTPTIVLQDNMAPNCSTPPSATVSGGILNEEGEEVEFVMVEVSGDTQEEEETTETGTYAFDLPLENNYAVTPERDDNPINGVSTYDLVKISQHILETEFLSSPYKIIAADVNNSGNISTLDLVELRKLILFIETDFSNNNSWRFVDAEFAFPNPLDPFQTSFPEVYTINDLGEDMQADFVGVKIGDVNCSAAPNDFVGSGDDRNSGEDLQFFVEDQQLIAGETYTIDFQIDEVSNLQGYQFTLGFDQSALYFENLEAGTLKGMTENNFGLSLLDQGVITTSWHTFEMLNTQKSNSFSMTFTAMLDAQLSEVININSRYTKAQAYVNNDFSNVSLVFESENGITLDQFQLFQNRPNPFKAETVVSFNLPENNAGTLTIYDLSGRVIQVVQADFTKGYNEVGINSTVLPGHGVFYYRLDVADHTATRRMVLLK